MNQLDWVGDLSEKPFRDIRNTRPTVAEEKAALVLQLGALINTAPKSLNSASVDRVREWKHARATAAKVAGNKRASIQELTCAISSMERFK